MANFRENIIATNLIARIESLIRVMRSSGLEGWDVKEKQWLAELLSPFSSDGKPEECHLVPSPNLSPYEGGLILEMLYKDFYVKNKPESELLLKKIKSLVALYIKLSNDKAKLNRADQEQILELALKLRQHMLDSVPSPAQVDLEQITPAYAW